MSKVRAAELANELEKALKKEPPGTGTKIEVLEGDWDLVIAGLKVIAQSPPAIAIGLKLSDYDRTTKDGMVDYATALATACHDDVAPTIRAMSMEERVIFFASWLRVATAHMRAAIGKEAARAIIDTLKLHADGKLPSGGKPH